MASHADTIPIARPLLDEREAEAVSRVLASGWVSQGPEAVAFEEEFADLVGAEHACAVSSCTAALHLALLTVGVKPGDEVVTVSHSFIATANAIRYCGAVPVFVDIQPRSYNLDPDKLELAIGPATRAILAVHQLGMPCDLKSVLAIAERYSLPVVEDAACAIGSRIRVDNRWEFIGLPHGDIACFSFHPRKTITTGDGGMLTTHNQEFARRFRLLRQHGMSVSDNVRHRAREVIFESYLEVGFNYRMTDIQAAVGRVQLQKLSQILERRRQLARRYHMLLAELPELTPPMEPDWARTNWQSYCVRLPEERMQKPLMQALLDSGIATRRGVMCAHREPAYPRGTWLCQRRESCTCDPNGCEDLRQSEMAQDQCVLLPLYPQMSIGEQDRVVAAIHRAIKG